MIAIGVSFWETVLKPLQTSPRIWSEPLLDGFGVMHAIAFSSIIKTAKLLKVGD
jgi:hypothetical protein